MAHLESQREIPYNTFKAKNPLIGEVLETYRLTPPERPPTNDVRHMVLSSPGLEYLAGQSVGVVPEGLDPRTGKPHKLRLYSIASESKGDYGDGQTVSVVVVRHFWNEYESDKLVPGVCSKYLCDLEVGEKVRITGPVGKRFLLPDDFHKRDLFFVATGTGIAPFRGMLKEMFDQGYEGKAYLLFGVQYADCILYDNEFREHLEHPNFRYWTALSREDEKNPFPDDVPTRNDKLYVQVRLWEHRDEVRESLAKPDTMIYQCGLQGMEVGIFHVLDRIGESLEEETLSKRMQDEGRMVLEVY